MTVNHTPSVGTGLAPVRAAPCGQYRSNKEVSGGERVGARPLPASQAPPTPTEVPPSLVMTQEWGAEAVPGGGAFRRGRGGGGEGWGSCTDPSRHQISPGGPRFVESLFERYCPLRASGPHVPGSDRGPDTSADEMGGDPYLSGIDLYGRPGSHVRTRRTFSC